jgi:hypothetical protein
LLLFYAWQPYDECVMGVESLKWKAESGKQKAESIKLKIESGKWKAGSLKRIVESRKFKVESRKPAPSY